nr:MAG TPA: hypothetical protein [Caudoviricetes sp.]
MKRFGEDFELTQELLDDIAVYMNDEIRENIHRALAPCKPEDFLKAYINEDPAFEDILRVEFSIEP